MTDSGKQPPWMKTGRAQPRPVPVTYSQRLGKAAEARIPWESRNVDHARRVDANQLEAMVEEMRARGGEEASDTMEATGVVRDAPLRRFRAKDVIASSSWTGRRSLRDQVLVVEAFGPLALDSVHQLASAIEERRLNDPASADALQALKELHDALGELIARAERAKPLRAVWKRVERSKEKMVNAVWDGAQVMLVAPVLALGTATVLSFLSGFPMSEGMVTALCATGMGKDAILTLAKRK